MKEEQQIRWRKKEPLVVGNVVYHSIHSCELSEKEKEKARIELGETEAKKKEILEELKSRLSKDGKYRTDNSFLLRYVRVRKYDIVKAYENIKRYYEMRKENPDMFCIPRDLYCKKHFSPFSVLPYMTESGCIILTLDFALWQLAEQSYEDVMQTLLAMCDVISMNPKCQINGVIGIWDTKSLSLKLVSELLKKNRIFSTIPIAHYGLPWRVKKVILFNIGRLGRFAYNLVSPVVTKKLTERVVILGSDLTELHEHVNPAILPKKLGGKLDDDLCHSSELNLDNLAYLEYDRSFTGE